MLHHGDAFELLSSIESVDHTVVDPPYSQHVHGNERSSKGSKGDFNKIARLGRDLGFDHVTAEQITIAAQHFARITRRWIIVFTDAEESLTLWRHELIDAGLDYVRTGAWVRHTTPQFTGDRPAQGFEAIAIAHRKGRKKWNGGGKAGVWKSSTVREGVHETRCHPTQKPIDLMLALVSDFTDEGETVLDAFMGSGTTGVAALRLGREFIGIERDQGHFKTACERLEAEKHGQSLKASRKGQGSLF